MSNQESEHLKNVQLGRTSLEVSRVAFGTAPLASVFWNNDEITAVGAVERALASGMQFFDTAPFYGLGACETRLGQALSNYGGDVVIATKAGRLLETGVDGELDARVTFAYDDTMRSLEASLERLGRDRVNIVHVHDPDDHLEEALAGTHRALVEMRDQGVIDAVSVGTNSVETARFFLERGDIDSMLVAGRYTLLDQEAADLISACAEKRVAYLAAGVFNSGILARPIAGSWFDYAPASPEVLERTHGIQAICDRHGVPLRTAALRFSLRNPDVTSLVIGMGAEGEVDENLRALNEPIPVELWDELDEEYRRNSMLDAKGTR